MKEIIFIALVVVAMFTNKHIGVTETNIIAAINDNGCATKTNIEIKPPVYKRMWPNWSE